MDQENQIGSILAVVREIVEAYGGRITIGKSGLGGALIELHLPGNT